MANRRSMALKYFSSRSQLCSLEDSCVAKIVLLLVWMSHFGAPSWPLSSTNFVIKALSSVPKDRALDDRLNLRRIVLHSQTFGHMSQHQKLSLLRQNSRAVSALSSSLWSATFALITEIADNHVVLHLVTTPGISGYFPWISHISRCNIAKHIDVNLLKKSTIR